MARDVGGIVRCTYDINEKRWVWAISPDRRRARPESEASAGTFDRPGFGDVHLAPRTTAPWGLNPPPTRP